MKNLKENHQGFCTILALALIPLSGFATDIYLPSLPSMAKDLHVSASAIQLSLVFFMFSLGVSQIFIGVYWIASDALKLVLRHWRYFRLQASLLLLFPIFM